MTCAPTPPGKLRAARSEPVIRALEAWGLEIPRRFLPKSAKLNGLEPAAYVTQAVVASLKGEKVLPPHELKAQCDPPRAST